MHQYLGTQPPEDDITVVIVKVGPRRRTTDRQYRRGGSDPTPVKVPSSCRLVV